MVSSKPGFINLVTSVAREVEEKVAQFLKGPKIPASNLFLDPKKTYIKGDPNTGTSSIYIGDLNTGLVWYSGIKEINEGQKETY